MDEFKTISQYAPYLLPFLGAVLVIVFTKKYLFTGMISTDMHKEQITREIDLVKVQEKISGQLQEVVKQLENITRKTSEDIRSNNGRMSSLERSTADYIDEYHELNKVLLKESIERERLVQIHYKESLDHHKALGALLKELMQLTDERIVSQILRLDPEERAMISNVRANKKRT